LGRPGGAYFSSPFGEVGRGILLLPIWGGREGHTSPPHLGRPGGAYFSSPFGEAGRGMLLCIVLKKLTLFIFCQTVTGKHNLLFLKIFRKEKFYL